MDRCIYKIINLKNNKIYVGQTTQGLTERFRQHKRASIVGKEGILFSAFRKYGIENFKIEILEVCEKRDDLNVKEASWIKKLNSLAPNGYNITPMDIQGVYPETYIKLLSERVKKYFQKKENREKISKITKNYWDSVDKVAEIEKRRKFKSLIIIDPEFNEFEVNSYRDYILFCDKNNFKRCRLKDVASFYLGTRKEKSTHYKKWLCFYKDDLEKSLENYIKFNLSKR